MVRVDDYLGMKTCAYGEGISYNVQTDAHAPAEKIQLPTAPLPPQSTASDANSEAALDKSLLEINREIPVLDVRRFAGVYDSSSLRLPVSGVLR